MTSAGPNALASGTRAGSNAPPRRQALLLTTCLAAAGAGAVLIMAPWAPARAASISTATNTSQNWSTGDLTITNTGSVIVSAGTAVQANGSPGTLTNNGTITGVTAGVAALGSIASITNSGLISGAQTANVIDGILGVLSNSGVISGGTIGVEVHFATLNSLNNTAGGTITGSVTGLLNLSGDIGALTNSGTIKGGTVGVYAGHNGAGTLTSLVNASGGVISGGQTGFVDAMSIASTISNSGTITGSVYGANINGNAVSIANTGLISGGRTGLIINNNGVIGTLSNSGLISGGTIGLQNYSGSIATLTNSVGGTITGGHTGLVNSDNFATLINKGFITGGTIGVFSNSSWTLLNNSAGGSIHGATTGVLNDDNLTTLSNSGSITGGTVGVANAYHLTTLVNSIGGYIEGGHTGLSNNATLGTVSNAGTITGSIFAINNSGSLGGISNTGLIAGNILNSAAQDLSVAGGTSGTFGTLSGYVSGSIGTITNTLGNVVLSGDLLLNDSVNVTGHTLVNNGGDVSLTANISVAGAFSQTSGTMALGSASELIVGGAASITGGTVAGAGRFSTTGNYLVSDPTTTLVQGGTGSNYTGVSVSSGLNGLAVVSRVASNALLASPANDYVGGSLAALVNTSPISGQAFGIYEASTGSIGSVSNSGVLIGSQAGIYVAGAIGSLSNAGSLSGLTPFGNNGTIGAVTNTGVIGSTLTTYGAINYNQSGSLYGSIGTFTNAVGGVISGHSFAFINSAQIGTLINQGSIVAADFGIANLNHLGDNGTIALLSNSGLISGRTGIQVSAGAIGALSNSGTITGGQYALQDSGSIGALNNSGTITGATALFIYGAGTIGQITNTGVMAGNIVNTSGHDLTIAGGTGAAYGALTGLNGSIGTISDSVLSTVTGSIYAVPETVAAGGDVSLSGNNLLNDILILGSHKLVNAGALQVNNAINITGGYSQSSGGLISGVASPTKYGQLLVSGTAALTGGLVGLQPLSAGILATGQTYTLVQASTLTVSNVTAQVASFSASISTIAAGAFEDLVLTVGAPLANWTSIGHQAGGPANPIGVALDQIAAGTSGQQQQFQTQILNYLSGLPLAQQEKALEQLSPNQMVALASMADTSPALDAILQHLDVFGSARGDFELASLSDDYYGDVYGEQGRGLWGKIVGGGAIRTDSAAAYGSTDYGLVFGADVYRSASALWGVSASWLHANVTGHADLSGSTNAVDSYQLTAYGAYKPAAWGGHWLISGQAAYAYNRYDQDRRIDAFNVTARTAYAGQQYLANGVVGYVFNQQGYNLTVYTGLREVHVANPSYTEGGAGQLDMQVGALALDSLTQETGVKYDGVTSWQYGKLYPSVTVGWAHDYTNGPIPITGTLAGVTFVDPAKRPSPDGLTLGAGVNAQLKGWSIGLEYQGEIRSDFQSHTAAIKANFKF